MRDVCSHSNDSFPKEELYIVMLPQKATIYCIFSLISRSFKSEHIEAEHRMVIENRETGGG
jgi:hypothetical protein